MEENATTPEPVKEVKTEEVSVETPKTSAPAKKKSHKLLIIVLIIFGILIALVALVGFSVQKAFNSLDPELKKGVGQVYECSKKCQALPKDQQNACAQKCVEESDLNKYISGMPTQGADSGSVSDSGVYTNAAQGFSFTPPPGWTQGTQQGVIVMYTNPKSPQTSINIISEAAPGFNVATYASAAKEQLAKAIPGYKISNGKNVTVNGVAGYQMDGSFSQEGQGLVNRQLILVKDGKVYVLTATSTPDAWTANQSAIDSSLNSFKIN